jgi:hypothetical protein
MARNRLIIILLSWIILATSHGCKKYYADDNSGKSGIDSSEETDDYTWDASKVVSIQLNGTSVTENSDSVEVDGTTFIITGSGTYRITGNLSDGHIIVNTGSYGIVRLLFGGMSITSSSGAPVFVKKAGKVVVILEEGTTNALTDGKTYVLDDNEEPNAALFSKTYLGFAGKGTLTVKANYNDGITSKDGLVIKEGNYSVTATDDGIRGKDYIEVHDGKIAIASGGDGLKSDNESDTDRGNIGIDAGSFNITSGGDAISAINSLTVKNGNFELESGGGTGSKGGPTPPGGGPGGSTGGYSGTVSAKGLKGLSVLDIEKGRFTINSADDAIHSNNSVTLNGGTFTISTGDDAIHADKSIILKADSLTVLTSYEGIESASIDYVSGYMNLASTDDGFNATMGSPSESDDGSVLKIEGGDIQINASQGDGIDSNGSVAMTGGIVIVNGPQSQPEVGIDVNGPFTVSGGILLATGPNSGNMIEAISTTSKQYAVKVVFSTTLAASTLVHIENSDGEELITYKPVRSIYYLVYSSPELKTGTTYSVYTGGSYSGTQSNGYYTGGIYSEGILRKTFSLSEKVTTVSF